MSEKKSMKLSFKGDKKKTKSSKRHRDDDPDAPSGSSSKRRSAKADHVDDPGAWVFPEDANEVSGPTFLWAPTDPPTTISYDAQRSRVIAAPLAPPSPSQASHSSQPPALAYEPTSIDSVWVVSKLSGASSINLRTAGGNFLGCDRFGVVSATSESRGPLENFTPHVLESSLVALETSHGTFLSISTTATNGFTLRGDSTSIGFAESFHCKVQAGFRQKARLQALEEGGRGKAKGLIRGEELDEAALNKERQLWTGNRHIVSKESKKELRDAKKEGRLSEALLDRRSKLKSDKFC